jgi:hypothetical protein
MDLDFGVVLHNEHAQGNEPLRRRVFTAGAGLLAGYAFGAR